MYTLAIRRSFIAQRLPAAGGREGGLRSHHYLAEFMLEGEGLDSNGYLVDFEDLGVQVEAVIDAFRDQTLDEIDAFAGLHPSIELFSRILCQRLDDLLYAPNVAAISIKLWEDEQAWAAYDLERA
ncbi:MAG: 6-carboxytetrahydropterin synthase [Caldilineales bacterium]|nr:6-carboxytetrahydropterin synthase [Caldilineales bacterium]